jgi:predicted nuclease with TOPRIM domain
MQYSPLIKKNSSPRSLITTLDSIDTIQRDCNDHLCRTCKNKLMKKQETTHTPMECLSQRCELLENEVTRLKDHDMKSNLRIKELENKIIALEDAIGGLTASKLPQATPYSFGVGHKFRHQLKKSESEDLPTKKSEINYDNILQLSRSNTKERPGLFGSLGAASQR